jgi:hypothetical protein
LKIEDLWMSLRSVNLISSNGHVFSLYSWQDSKVTVLLGILKIFRVLATKTRRLKKESKLKPLWLSAFVAGLGATKESKWH